METATTLLLLPFSPLLLFSGHKSSHTKFYIFDSFFPSFVVQLKHCKEACNDLQLMGMGLFSTQSFLILIISKHDEHNDQEYSDLSICEQQWTLKCCCVAIDCESMWWSCLLHQVESITSSQWKSKGIFLLLRSY